MVPLKDNVSVWLRSVLEVLLLLPSPLGSVCGEHFHGKERAWKGVEVDGGLCLR